MLDVGADKFPRELPVAAPPLPGRVNSGGIPIEKDRRATRQGRPGAAEESAAADFISIAHDSVAPF
jgi:hypothetical protein